MLRGPTPRRRAKRTRPASPAVSAPGAGRAAFAAARASARNVALAGGEREVGRARPGFELGKPALARQVLRIAPGVVPLSDRLDETPVEEEVLAALLDPPA